MKLQPQAGVHKSRFLTAKLAVCARVRTLSLRYMFLMCVLTVCPLMPKRVLISVLVEPVPTGLITYLTRADSCSLTSLCCKEVVGRGSNLLKSLRDRLGVMDAPPLATASTSWGKLPNQQLLTK